jgi:hypothetical protein
MTHTRKNRSPIGVVVALEAIFDGTSVAMGSAAELSTSRVTKKGPAISIVKRGGNVVVPDGG